MGRRNIKMVDFITSFRKTLDFSVGANKDSFYLGIKGREHFPKKYIEKLYRVETTFINQFREEIENKFLHETVNEKLEHEIDRFVRYHNEKALEYEASPYDTSIKIYKSLEKIFDKEFTNLSLDMSEEES